MKELGQHRIINSLSLNVISFAAPLRLVILESSTIFLLLKRGRGKQEWWEGDVQIRLQTEVRRLQKNTEGRVTPNSLSAQRTQVLSNTESRVSLCFYLSHFHSFYIVYLGCSLSTPLSACLREGRCHRVVRSSLVHLHMGLSFRKSMSSAGCLHTMVE